MDDGPGGLFAEVVAIAIAVALVATLVCAVGLALVRTVVADVKRAREARAARASGFDVLRKDSHG